MCSYFREFGAIERVQILPERPRIWDIVPPIPPEPHDTKFYAYVTFVNPLGVVEVFRHSPHIINDVRIKVQKAHSWHQPGAENIDLPVSRLSISNSVHNSNRKIYASMDMTLNDDCILRIMSYLNIFELFHICKYSPRFAQIARQQRTINISGSAMIGPLTMLHLRKFFRLYGFGQGVFHLTIQYRAISYYTANDLFYEKLFQYIGPQLRSLSLQSFSTQTHQLAALKPTVLNLANLDIDLNYEFDYEEFNDIWPNLETLRIHSSSCIQIVCKDSQKPTSFPILNTLIVISRYKLYEHLFENIVTHFRIIQKLIIINVEDYYTQLPNRSRTDFSFTSQLTNLTKLHLSCSQSYVNHSFWKTLGEMYSLNHLTLEITKSRNQDSRVRIKNLDLSAFANGLINISELRLAGFALTGTKIIQLIRHGIQLDTFSIFNCGLEISSTLICDLVNVRKMQLSKRAYAGVVITLPKPLHLTFDNSSNLSSELVSSTCKQIV